MMKRVRWPPGTIEGKSNCERAITTKKGRPIAETIEREKERLQAEMNERKNDRKRERSAEKARAFDSTKDTKATKAIERETKW